MRRRDPMPIESRVEIVRFLREQHDKVGVMIRLGPAEIPWIGIIALCNS